MNDLARYITDLLTEHDCVIIPGFGAFIANYQPSFITGNKIYPPSKKIAFNPSLNTNDGLLFHSIAEKKKISYEQSAEMTLEMINDWKKLLSSGDIVRINRLGELQIDPSGKLIFSPYNSFNYLIDSYGLEAVTLTPVERRKLIPEHQPVQKVERTRNFVRKRKGDKKILYYSLSLYLPFLAFLWVLFLLREPFKGEVASFYPVTTEVRQDNQVEATSTEIISPDQETEKKVIDAEKTEQEPEHTEPINDKYFLIAGCFKEKQNAEKFRDELIAKGYTYAQILEDNNFTRVSVHSFADLDQAKKILQEINSNSGLNVWILNK